MVFKGFSRYEDGLAFPIPKGGSPDIGGGSFICNPRLLTSLFSSMVGCKVSSIPFFLKRGSVHVFLLVCPPEAGAGLLATTVVVVALVVLPQPILLGTLFHRAACATHHSLEPV